MVIFKMCAEVEECACECFNGTENVKGLNVADEIWFTDFSHKVFNIPRRNFDTFLSRFARSRSTTNLFILTSGNCCLWVSACLLSLCLVFRRLPG